MSEEVQASVDEAIEALQNAGLVATDVVEETPLVETVKTKPKRKRAKKTDEPNLDDTIVIPDLADEPSPLALLYNKEYYDTYDNGAPYGFFEPWTSFFGVMANRLASKYRPRTAIDAGAAFGVLVNALRNRKIDAVGFDISEYAAAQSPSNTVAVDDLSADWSGREEKTYDLITCIEVLEHIPDELAGVAIKNLVSLAHDKSVIVFSSVPPFDDDEDNETHINVQPEIYWTTLFEEHGFVKTDDNVSYICPWAIVLKRK